MPTKKIKKKTTVAKPKVTKPRVKKTKQTKPPKAPSVSKPVQPIQIITQKLPRTKCCTDPLKSGQSYTIPLGYTDRLGTMRIPDNSPTPIPINRIPVQLKRPNPITIQKPINEVITITEEQPVVKEVTKNLKPRRKLIIEDDSGSENIVISAPAAAKEKKPRRNSLEDFKIRYEMVTGNPFTRVNLTKKEIEELKQEVQDLEQRRESNIKDTKN